MEFKTIITLVDDEKTDEVIEAARRAGATGVTVVPNARGEGLNPKKTFFGLSMDAPRDLLLLVVEASRASQVMATIAEEGDFDRRSGAGIAIQLAVEATVGVAHQVGPGGEEET